MIIRPGIAGTVLAVEHLNLVPRNSVMCRQLYRYSLRPGTAIDGLFRQGMRLSIFLQDNCHGVSVVRPSDSRSNGGYMGQWTLTKRKRTGSFRLPKA